MTHKIEAQLQRVLDNLDQPMEDSGIQAGTVDQ